MRMNRSNQTAQEGSIILESMIALLIFFIGILGLVSLHGNAVREVSEAKYRAEAAFLANQVAAEMWANAPNLAAYAYNGSGAPPSQLSNWIALVDNVLPGAAANRPVITVTGAVVKIVVKWSPPGESMVHAHSLVTTVSR